MDIFPPEIIMLILQNLIFDELIPVANTCKLFRLICIDQFNYQKKMKSYRTVFKAIRNFIDDLYREFGKESIQLERYKRLRICGEFMIGKSVSGFKEFFQICETTDFDYGLAVHRGSTIPEGVHIRYEGNIYIDVIKFIRISTPETLKNIHKHLLYISILLKVDKKKIALLKELNEPKKDPLKFNWWTMS